MLAELKTKHREIARLSFEGLKPVLIAKQTGVGLATVYKILRDPICKGYIGGLADSADKSTLNVRERLMKLNANALECFEDILSKDSKAPYSVQATVGKDVLDRTGNKAPDKLDINHTLHGKSDEEIDAQIASLESQINATYNSDLTANPDDDDDDDELTKAEKAKEAELAKINPKTDWKES